MYYVNKKTNCEWPCICKYVRYGVCVCYMLYSHNMFVSVVYYMFPMYLWDSMGGIRRFLLSVQKYMLYTYDVSYGMAWYREARHVIECNAM